MPTQKNILIFMTDHQRGDTILNSSKVLTPNIDRLRRNAVTFTKAACPAPHCCPSRATFFSGLYPSQHGVWNNVEVGNALSHGLYDGVTLFSEDLKKAGYDLYYSGKWHVSKSESPADRGFTLLKHRTDGYCDTPNLPEYSEWKYYDDSSMLDREDTPRGAGQIVRPGYRRYLQYGINEDPFGDREAVEAAVEQLLKQKDSDRPFVVYAGATGPHDPYVVPQRFLDLYDPDKIELPDNFDDPMEDKPVLYRRTQSRYAQLSREEHKESVRRFYAFCSYEDYLFGKLLDALEQSGHTGDTMVVYCSDHGDYIGSHGLWAKGLPCFKEAYHVCAMVGGIGIVNPGRECDAPVNLADFAPTFLELAGVAPQRKFMGSSLMPFLRNEQPDGWRTEQYSQTNGNEIYGIQRAVWNKKWKYVFNSFDYDELYDLENDPQELHNLIYGPHPEKTEYGHIVRELCKKMWGFAYNTHDNCVNPYIMTALAPYGPGIIFEDEAYQSIR